MATIKIDNRDTRRVHIDTYSMLTGDGFIESTIEHESENAEKGLDYDDFDWNFNHAGIVRDLATASIGIIGDALPDDTVIKSIKLETTSSPQFYNYTTDGYVMTVEYNEEALAKYTEDNKKEIREYLSNYPDVYWDHTPIGDIKPEHVKHASLCHYIDNLFRDDDEYNYSIWECEYEAYANNCDYKLVKKDNG